MAVIQYVSYDRQTYFFFLFTHKLTRKSTPLGPINKDENFGVCKRKCWLLILNQELQTVENRIIKDDVGKFTCQRRQFQRGFNEDGGKGIFHALKLVNDS